MTEETQEHNNLLRPKSGTATSSPTKVAPPSNKGFTTTIHELACPKMVIEENDEEPDDSLKNRSWGKGYYAELS